MHDTIFWMLSAISDIFSPSTEPKQNEKEQKYFLNGTGVKDSADFSKIRYSQVHEDTRILRKALDLNSLSVVLSIASSGDNVLGLLLDNPKKVVAIDFSFAQLALCALKISAIQHLTYAEFVHLIGFKFAKVVETKRQDLYHKIRPFMEKQYSAYWDIHIDTIAGGLVHYGRLEKYFNLYNTTLLRLSHSKANIISHLTISDPLERQTSYDTNFADSWLYQSLARLYFGETLLGLMGRDKAFFKHVKLDVSQHNIDRFKHALRDLKTTDNFYLEYILTGDISGKLGLPNYLMSENYEVLKSRVSRIELVQGDLKSYLMAPQTSDFDAFNLSDIFEWMDQEMYVETIKTIVSKSRKGARLAYWNLFVPRRRPESMKNVLFAEKELSESLYRSQRTVMYRNFVVERVL